MILVASYNIRKAVGTDWRRDPDRILGVLAEIDADIVALQEVDRRFGSRESALSASFVAAHSGYKAIDFSPRVQSVGWHGNTILVRKDHEVLYHTALELPALEPRGAVLADIRTPDGVRVRVIGLHLGLVDLWRRRQAQSVLHQLDQLDEVLPTIIMGDLNQWTTEGGALAHFSEHHQIIAPGPSFHAARPFVSFDRIITTTDVTMIEAGVHRSALSRRGSDHLPIWARLEVGNT